MHEHYPATLRVYAAIHDFIVQRRKAPTIREIGAVVFLSHTAVLPHLARLEAWGWIERDERSPRSIRLGPHAPQHPPVLIQPQMPPAP
jgi:SOS-response transcriptional repressor LexA